MSNDIRIEIQKSEFDSDNDLIGGTITDLISQEYDSKTCGSFNLLENSSYVSIPFSQVEEGNLLIVESSEIIDIRLNNGEEIFNMSYIFLQGSFTALEFRNNNDNSVDIEYEIYGKG